MPTTITPLAISILALLVERPMHPYEMYQTLIRRAEERVVKVRPGSLYHTVDRLHEQGLVRQIGTKRDGNRPEHTTYELTEAGRLTLTERICEMLATPVNEYPRFPLALGQAHNLPKRTVVELLGRRLLRLTADRDYLMSGRVGVERDGIEPRYWIDLGYQIAMCQAEITWLETLITDLSTAALSWTPAQRPPCDGNEPRSTQEETP